MVTIIVDGKEYRAATMAEAVKVAAYHHRVGASEVVVCDVYGNRSYYLGG